MQLPTAELLALAAGENLAALRRLPAETLMVRWLNRHVCAYLALHPDHRSLLETTEMSVRTLDDLCAHALAPTHLDERPWL